MEPNESVFSMFSTDYDQQLTLLDEQEQQDTVDELFQMALNQKKHVERIMAAMGLFFSLSTACVTIYHAFLSLRPSSIISIKEALLLSCDEESKKEFACNTTFVLGGLYSAYLHLLAAARNVSGDAGDLEIDCLTILTNPLHLVGRMVRSLVLPPTLENEENYLCVHRHRGTQVLLLDDSILLLMALASPIIYLMITCDMTRIPSTSIYISATSYCNILTAVCCIYLRRETIATLSSLEQVKKAKYHYKSL